MSKPTLSQIVELNEGKSDYLMVIQDQRALYVRNEKVIKHFGDVEIKDLMILVEKSSLILSNVFSVSILMQLSS